MATGLPSAQQQALPQAAYHQPPHHHHQRKLGPAPIASFEDLSDEVENGEQAAAGRLPGIVEVTTPATPGSSLKTPSTPRIDISRASSSSHHEDSNSRESTPERELLAGADPPAGCKLTLGYKEDAQDLRSSTEELDLQDPIHEQDLKRESKRRKRKDDGSMSDYSAATVSKQLQDRERHDSNCSEIVLLNISGRTSRLSSVGSQGSGVSGKLSVVSATSSRSPSPHKCLLETSFCGSRPTLADNMIEPTKTETEDLERILLKREADTTKALIPESIKVPIVGGNLKPDPLDKPRRRGREERKEIFKREVEITKRFLERVNIEIPIAKKATAGDQELPPPHPAARPSSQEVQKPATLDFNDRRKKTQNFKEIVQTTPTTGSSATGSPKLPRHQKVRDLEGSRTPSPSSVSRRSSFASLFKARTDSGTILSPESPTSNLKPRRSLTTKLKDTTETLRSRSKSRERSSIDKGSAGSTPLKKDSKNKGFFSSTLGLFKKTRERKKSYDEAIASSCFDGDGSHVTSSPVPLGSSAGSVGDHQQPPSLESIGPVEFTFDSAAEKDRRLRKDDSIFISLHADDRNYEVALPSESVSIPLETPTKLLDEYDAEQQQQRPGAIVTEVSIEHHRAPSSRDRSEPNLEALTRTSSKDERMSKSSSRDSNKIVTAARASPTDESKSPSEQRASPSVPAKETTTTKKPQIVKPKRKSKENQQQQKLAEQPVDRAAEEIRRQEVEKQQQQQTLLQQQQQLLQQQQLQKQKFAREEPRFPVDQLERPEDALSKAPSMVSDLDHDSSESERDSEIDFIRNKAEKLAEELPDERKGLFYEESFEEDFPYVPTTLPLEKSAALPILPVKQRLQEVRTIPIERPRSTTPINPTLLDEFVMHTSTDEQRRVERMKISLPREDSFKLKSPKKHGANTFTEFAGKVSSDIGRGRVAGKSPSPPPPLPPRAPSSGATPTATRPPSNWINFEEIPEKRKAPKRIQTIPRPEDEAKATVYSYVQPEECRCECHEESRRTSLRGETTSTTQAAQATTSGTRRSSCSSSSNGEQRACNGENCAPSNGNNNTNTTAGSSGDRASIISDSSLDCSLSMEDSGQATQALLGTTKPFSMDLDVSSNRSSVVSQEDNDENQH